MTPTDNKGNFLQSAWKFVGKDIWKIRGDELQGSRRFLIQNLRVIILAVKGFREDKCQLKASALTLYTLLSVVPVVALIFGIAKGFGMQAKLQEQLIDNFKGHEEAMNWILEFATSMLERTKGGMIAGVGVVLLIWSVMKVLGNIESSFNDIWNIRKSRPLTRKFTDYLAVMLIAPILMIIASSFTVFISTTLSKAAADSSLIGYIGPALKFLIKFAPYVIIWILFTLLYIIMPNTSVKLKAGLIAGIIAGTLYQLLQWGYIEFQVLLSSYNAIYGSFAALPLLLIWLQFSWLIILLGAEISFAKQNVFKYEFEAESNSMSFNLKQMLALLVMTRIVKNFVNGTKPMTAPELSISLQLPIGFVRQIIYELDESGIICEVRTDKEKEHAYQPATDVNRISVHFVLQRIRERGYNDFPLKETTEKESLSKILKDFEQITETASSNKLIREL